MPLEQAREKVTMTKNSIIIAGVVVLITGYLMATQPATADLITPAEVQELVKKDSTVVLLDVRTSSEYTGPQGHIAGTLLIPVQELEQRIGELTKYKKQRIIAVCRSGNRSGQAVSILRAHGFDAVNMAGGMNSWNSAQLPVVRR